MTGANTPLIRPAENVGNGQVLYGRIKAASAAKDAARPPEYGYIALFGMKEFGKNEGRDTPDDESVNSARLAMKQAISSLRGVRGVIIDLRYNGGGGDAVAVAVAGFFTDQPVKAYSKRVYYNGKVGEPYQVVVRPEISERLSVPIAILTSDFTVSAAEVCVLALKALPRSVQIGQPTRGSLSDRLHKVMPNGWTISLSNEIYADRTGGVFEVRGVPPDIATVMPPPESPDEVRYWRDIAVALKALP
jgi:C-terminal processing protease CtpA/Prc